MRAAQGGSRIVRRLLSTLLLALGWATSGAATTYYVDSAVGAGGDANPGDGICATATGTCTLFAALQEAVDGDEIRIPSFNIAAGNLSISADIRIVGDVYTRIFSLSSLRSVDISGAVEITSIELVDHEVSIQPGASLRLTDAWLNSPINNEGLAILDDVEIDGATSAPVDNSAPESVLSANRLTIENTSAGSTLATGVRNLGTATVTNSLIWFNEGDLPGSAPVYNSGGHLLLSNTLISNNRNNYFDTSGLATCTTAVDNNSGGRVDLNHVTIRSNDAPDCTKPVSLFGPITSTGAGIFPRATLLDPPFGAKACTQSGTAYYVSLGYNVATEGSCTHLDEPTDVLGGTIADASDRVPAAECPVVDVNLDSRSLGDGACDTGSIDSGSDPACNNGGDDDGDGFVDLLDPGCADPNDPSEVHLRPGDFVVANSDTGSTTLFDPVTTRLAPITRASGLVEPWDVLVDVSGEIMVSDSSLDALTRVDPEALFESLVSAGGAMSVPTGLARDAGGDVLSAQNLSDDLLAIDPATGVQTVLLNDPSITDVDDLLIDPADGSLLVSDPTNGLFRVSDPLGTASVSAFSTSVVQQSRQLVFDPATGDVILADDALSGPIRFDPDTSTDIAMLSGAPFTDLQGAGAEAGGLFLFADLATGLLSRVDEAADTATPLNVGRAEPGLRHMAEVPEPATLTLELTDALVTDGGTPNVPDAGDVLEFTAVVTNTGPSTADLLSFESNVHPPLTLVGGSISTSQGSVLPGVTVNGNVRRLEIDLGSLAPSASATVAWEAEIFSTPQPTVTANAWIRREKLILAESDDPSTGPAPDPNVIGVGDYGIVVQAVQKISDTRGGFSGPGNPGAVLAESGFFGGSAEPLGDLDGDGIDDVAIGAYRDDEGGGPGYGAFFILLLEADGTVKQRFEWNAASPDLAAAVTATGLPLGDDQLGSGIAWLGDLDGAGPADFALAVGAWYSDGLGGVDEGAVYILFMDESPLQVLSAVRISDDMGGFPPAQLGPNGYFGWDVENIGDVDGDGVTDLAVGQHHRDDPGLGADVGGVWILFLNADGTVKSSPAPQLLVPPTLVAGDFYGLGIAALGLFDGDAVPDIAIGATRRDGGGLTDAGAVFVTTLNADGTVKTQTEISSGMGGLPSGLLADDDRFGRGLDALPDLDGDGTPELVVGANRDDDAGVRTGAAYVLFLAPAGTVDRAVQLAPQPGVLFHELQDNDRFGISIAPLGDLDANGSPEIAVGALLDNDGAGDAGAVYVLHTATPLPEPGALMGLACGFGFLLSIRAGRTPR